MVTKTNDEPREFLFAAQAALSLAAIEQSKPADLAPVQVFSRLLTDAATKGPANAGEVELRILNALPRVLHGNRLPPTQQTANEALVWSQRLDAGSKGELNANDVKAAKLFCLRMSDALGKKHHMSAFN